MAKRQGLGGRIAACLGWLLPSLLLAHATHAQAALEVYPGCAAPAAAFAHAYHVSPSAKDGDGSAPAPFGTLAQALAKARGGDVIYLASGHYGVVRISGVNADFITIAAEPGQAPVLDNLLVTEDAPASHWAFEGLTVLGFGPGVLSDSGWPMHTARVQILSGDNIVFAHNTVASAEGSLAWAMWTKGTVPPQTLTDGVFVNNASCVSVSDNRIFNVFNGIVAGGDLVGDRGRRLLVSGNRIRDFGADGIDHDGSDITIRNNVIQDAHNLCESACIHADGIQGWNYNNRPGLTNANIVIDGNVIVDRTDPHAAGPTDALQGIDIFDGDWDGVRITNNVVIVTAWHGITLFGGRHALIANNTVLGTTPGRRAWIMVGRKKPMWGSDLPSDVAVRDNLAEDYKLTDLGRGKANAETRNHNADWPSRMFVTFDTRLRRYDLHPRHKSKDTAGAPDAVLDQAAAIADGRQP